VLLTDDREYQDFIDNCLESDEEIEIIKDLELNGNLTEEAKEILNKNSHHIYAVAWLAIIIVGFK